MRRVLESQGGISTFALDEPHEWVEQIRDAIIAPLMTVRTGIRKEILLNWGREPSVALSQTIEIVVSNLFPSVSGLWEFCQIRGQSR
jgi:hypothetical protein